MKYRTLQLVVAGIWATLVVAACGSATASPPQANDAVHRSARAASASPATVTAGTPREERLLKLILDGMHPADIVSVGITGPPVTAPNVPPTAVWLAVVHPSATAVAPADLARARWEGLVVASAYLEKCRAAGVPCIQGVEMVGQHGSTDGDFAGLVGISQDNHSPSSSDGAIASALTASAQAAGLRSVSVSFEDAAGFSVPVVSGETGDPASFVRNYRNVVIFGNTQLFADFVEVAGPSGSPVLAEGLSGATQAGVSWFRRGLRPANALGGLEAGTG